MPGDLDGARRRGYRAERGRRPGVVHDGVEPRGRRRPQRRARRHHVLHPGRLRRRRRMRNRRPGRDGDRDRSVRGRGRVAGPQARRPDEPSVGPDPRAARRQPAVEPAVGNDPPRRRDRDADPPLHARVRRDTRSPRQRRAGVPEARGAQPGRDDGPQADDARVVHERAVDLRTTVPPRQLPGDRRRTRGRDHISGAGPRPEVDARVHPLVRAGSATAAPDDDQLLLRRSVARPRGPRPGSSGNGPTSVRPT